MTSSRLLLDAFSCAGLAGDGYAAAGWEVVALDNDPRALRHNPYHSVLGDALRYLGDPGFLRQFDAIHASPPCQLFSATRSLADAQGHGRGRAIDLLTPTLAALRATDVPWVVENVERSPLKHMSGTVRLCGSSWGLEVERHRLFLPSPGLRLEGSVCDHSRFPIDPVTCKPRPYGVYYKKGTTSYFDETTQQFLRGDVAPGAARAKGGRTVTSLAHGVAAMGVGRSVPWTFLCEGLPPVYTEYIGRQMLTALEAR